MKTLSKVLHYSKKKRCDFVIAIGGGSVIDMAKLINSCQVHDVTPEEIVLSNKIENSGKTLVAIPTTAGTGSEATAFAVVYINSVKYSLSHNKLLPKIAILDPQFSYNLPKYLTAVSGMDAFAQAIESFWNVNSNTESLMYAREAINLIWHELPIVLKHNTKSARLKLLKGAHMAGKAINITKTTAPHALSYPFTAHFGLPHGHAVALTLPNFVEYNYNVNDQDCNDPRGVDYVKECIEQLAIIMNFKTVKDLRSGLDQFIKRIGINISRNRFHFDKKSNLDLILKNINLQRFKNNPRNLNSELLIKILMDNL